ncbi:MAG: hypothetical protein NT089_03725 [Planctomycetia bacterium]|nr:hypothetical protein [Planctomycetia bacterium]
MATIHYRSECRDAFDDSDEPYNDPLAVADTEHSDAVRAEIESHILRGEECDTDSNRPRSHRVPKQYHRIAKVRQQQGVTLRNTARRLGLDVSATREQEQPGCDLRLSELHCWQAVLEVPIAELLVEGDGQLSGPVLERSRMLKLMKTAAAIRARTTGTPVGRMVTMLIEQILEIMPELQDVSPWHNVGQRRTLDDLGRTARQTIPDDLFHRPSE